MHNYESLGGIGGNNWEGTVDGRAKYITPFAMPQIALGALVCVGQDGTRFIREDQFTRHGKAYNHGIWSTQNSQCRPYFILGEAQRQVIEDLKRMPDNWDDIAVSAGTVEELAELISIDPAMLARTVERFNSYAETGIDIEFDRPAETMRPFEGMPWAVALQPTVLNTQGDPRRNAKAQVIGLDGEPIPNLFSAGELGGMNDHYYNGGSNVAECLVSGRIAGTNAALGVE